MRSFNFRRPVSRAIGGPVVLAVLASLILASACGDDEFSQAQGGGQPVAAASVTPTYDPNEHDLTPTITPPAKEDGTEPRIPTQTAEEPLIRGVAVTFGSEPTTGDIAKSIDLFIKGRVVEILAPQWTTPTGERPADPHREDPAETYIITPVVIELDGPPILNRTRQEAPEGRIVVAAFGGKIGHDEVSINDPAQRFEIGEHVILGLTPNLHLNGDVERRFQTPLGLAWNVSIKYLISEDDFAVLTMPSATPKPVAEVISALTAAADAPTPTAEPADASTAVPVDEEPTPTAEPIGETLTAVINEDFPCDIMISAAVEQFESVGEIAWSSSQIVVGTVTEQLAPEV